MKHLLNILVICLVFGVLACERTSRELGGKKAPIAVSASEVDVPADLHKGPGLTYIAEVAPGSKQAPDGKMLFQANCAACHQLTGQGIPGAFPPLDGSEYVTSDNIARMASIMIYGLQGEISVKGQKFNSVMAPLGRLEDEELAAIASYVRSAWSNKSGPVKASFFTELRKKWGDRGPFKIEELIKE